MPFVVQQMTASRLSASSFACAALLGATMLASPLTAARAADAAGNAAAQFAQAAMPQSPTGAAATPQAATPQAATSQAGAPTKSETVEQRITSLHASLKITPAEDAKWNEVAKVMRQNAAAIDKVAEENQSGQGQMTALDDLKMYQKFAQAHVEGLKNLTSAFSALYAAMPEAQKKNADEVFQAAHQASSAHGQTG